MASPMAAAAAAGLVVLVVFASTSSAVAFKFNVTEILDEFPEFSVFNGLLSRTTLVDEINRRLAVTVLVVDNSAVGAITSLPGRHAEEGGCCACAARLLRPRQAGRRQGEDGAARHAVPGIRRCCRHRTRGVRQLHAGRRRPDGVRLRRARRATQLADCRGRRVPAVQPIRHADQRCHCAASIGGSSTPAISDGSKSPSSQPPPAKKTDTPDDVTTTAYEFDTPAGTSADYDDDDIVSPATSTPSPASEEGQAKANVPSTSPANETSATAHGAADRTTTSAASSCRAVVGGASVGFMGLVMFIIQFNARG
ncbi:hypothetical protein GUJ93_ZPchr0004g39553 [Zizania palustris]|uniref:Uncharacterized protein n=1 Tax=Zizania palustris TaxID=103762 RepID=A0A8J5RWA9_ZIZPA|nr:hypothetical protein GUJ93_ZPchr0004g39553 [Zizania palustris]